MEQDRRNRDSDFFMQDDYYYDEATGSFKKRADTKRPGSSDKEAPEKKHGGTAAFLSLLTAIVGVCAAAYLSAFFWISAPFFLRFMRSSDASTRQRRLQAF